MERAHSAEIVTGPFAELVELIVKDARQSVDQHETRDYRRQGCLEGLARCEQMKNFGVLEFEATLCEMETENKSNRKLFHDGQIDRAAYWRQRCAMAQVEYCYEILRVAHLARHGSLPDEARQDYSARAVMRYEILTMKLENPLPG